MLEKYRLIRECFLMIVIAYYAAFASSQVVPQLPDDEAELVLLLEDAVIDTFQYEQLLTLYALPLSVPQGEHLYLTRIFPTLQEALPTLDAIEDYRPFDNRQIRRLYNDYPALADFEPILRFNVAETRDAHSGEVIFGINRSNVSELSGHSARFRFRDRRLSVDGNVSLNDTGAMWRTRRVTIPIMTEGGGRGGQRRTNPSNVQLGNFAQPIPGELYYGRFSRLDADDDNDNILINNWLYGGSNTWNGVSVNVDRIPKFRDGGANAFFHMRGDERGGGAMFSYRPDGRTRVHASVTTFTNPLYVADTANVDVDDDGDNIIDDDPDNNVNNNHTAPPHDRKYLTTAQLHADYRTSTWRSSLEAALPLGYDNITPALSWRLSYRRRGTSAEYQLITYPQNFTAPMSRVKRRLLLEIGERESADAHAVRKYRLRMVAPVRLFSDDALRFVPEIDFTEYNGDVRRVHGRADARLRIGAADVSLSHASRIFPTGADSVLHTTRGSVRYQTPYPVRINAAAQRAYCIYRTPRNSYSLETAYTGLRNIVLTPFVRGRYTSRHTCYLGLKTELHLYRRTWTSVTLELPTHESDPGHVYIRASSSYAF